MSEKLSFPVGENRSDYSALHGHLSYAALKRWAGWMHENAVGQTVGGRTGYVIENPDSGSPYLARFRHISTTVFGTETQTVNMRPVDTDLPMVSMHGRLHVVKRMPGENPELGDWDYLERQDGLAWTTRVPGSGAYNLIATNRNFSTTHNPSIAEVQLAPGGYRQEGVSDPERYLFAAHAAIALSMSQMPETAGVE